MSSAKANESNDSLNGTWREVQEFHRAFGLPVSTKPVTLPLERRAERSNWMREELNEFDAANTVASQADAMIDLIYLAMGTLVEMGVPPARAFELVHASNMSKRWPDGVVRLAPDGKVLKPPAWLAPDANIDTYVRELSQKSSTG